MPVGRLNFSCRANRQKIQDFPAVMRAGKGNYARIARLDLGWRTAVASEPEASQKTIKVAEGFELDPAAYELRRSGHVVKLERLPMEILPFLIEQRGQVVTREEIADRIWGKNVHVDTDSSQRSIRPRRSHPLIRCFRQSAMNLNQFRWRRLPNQAFVAGPSCLQLRCF